MEKITSNNYNQVSSASQILDLSKNLNVKVDTTSGANFKDYVKTSSDNNKYEPKKETRVEKKDFKDNSNNDRNINDVKLKKDDAPKEVSRDKPQKDEIKNTNDNKDKTTDNNVNDKKTDDKATTEVKVTDKEQVKEEKVDVEEVKNTDEVNVQTILAAMMSISEAPKEVQDKLQEAVTPDIADKLIEQIESNKEMPVEVKSQLTELLKNVSKDGKIDLAKLSEIMKSGIIAQLPELKDVNVNDLFKKVLDSAEDSAKKEVVIQEQQTEVANLPKININQELNNLKNYMNLAQNGKQNGEANNVPQNTEIEENINPIFTGEGITNVKIIGMNTKIFTQNVRATMSNEQIQNFSKIVDEMRLAFKEDKTMLSIKLEPETLGKLSIKINSENGVFNASFNVESEKAKQAIEAQIHVLRQSLLDQGINIQDINVEVGQNNEDLNYHQNILEAINFSKRGGSRLSFEDESFDEAMNPYIVTDDILNELI